MFRAFLLCQPAEIMIDTDPSIQATLLVELESTPEAVMEQLVAIADNTGNEIPYAVTAFAADPHREVVAFLEAVEGEFTLVTAADVATALDRALAAARLALSDSNFPSRAPGPRLAGATASWRIAPNPTMRSCPRDC